MTVYYKIIANLNSCAPTLPSEPIQPAIHYRQTHRNHHRYHQKNKYFNHSNNNFHRRQAQNLPKIIFHLFSHHRLAQIGFHLILIQIYSHKNYLNYYCLNHSFKCCTQFFATIVYYLIIIKSKFILELLSIVVNFIAIILNNQQMQRRRNRVSIL
jgi:hypothetical protein